MLLNNPFTLNDWKYGNFIKFVIILQVLILVTVGLNIPILTPLIGFIYLTFIPGFLILRVLRLHNLGSIKSFLYSTGFSILLVMFTGFFLSLFLPLFGIYKPLSPIYLIGLMSIIVIFLSFISYLRDKNFYNDNLIYSSDLFSPILLFLCLIPFLAVFGSYFVNFYNNNLVSMLMFALIAIVTCLVGFNKIQEKFYPFVIWIIAISILYASTLISVYIWGWDIQNEYFLANMVYHNAYWNFSFPDAYNAMLSVVMLSPIYSIFTNLDLIYVYKIIYPLLFSLVPLGLYQLFKEQIDPKIAFFACFLVISFSSFFMILPSEGREMIAEFYLILILLLIFSNRSKMNSAIILLFSIGLVISHYSLTYFFILIMIGALILISIFYLYRWFYKIDNEDLIFYFKKIIDSRINLALIIFIALFAYLWYFYFASGLAVKGFTDLFEVAVEHLLQNVTNLMAKWGIIDFYLALISIIIVLIVLLLFVLKMRKNKIKEGSKKSFSKGLDNLLSPLLRSKMKYPLLALVSIIMLIAFVFLIGKPQTWIVAAQRYLNFVLVFFTVIGVSLAILHYTRNKFKKEYYALSIVNVLVLLIGIFFPIFENSFNITRIFQMTFLFLSPFCVIGGIMIFKWIFKPFNLNLSHDTPLKIFSIFLIILMLFNTGFFSVLSNTSIPVHLDSQSDIYPRFDYQETIGAQWLGEHRISDFIYGDEHGMLLFKKYIYYPIVLSDYDGRNNSYIFARKLNQENIFLITIDRGSKEKTKVYKDMSALIKTKNRIYDNGEAKSYFR